MKDPLTIATIIIGLGILMLLGKYMMTDKLDKEVLGLLTTLFGTLITVVTTRKKDEPPKDPPAPPPTPPEVLPPPVTPADAELPPLLPATAAPPEVSDAPRNQ